MSSASKKYLWMALLLSMLFLLIVHLPRLLDTYIVEEDFRNLYWLHRFQDNTLFIDDPLVQQQVIDVALGDYQFVYSKYSPGYGFLFQLGTLFFSPPMFSKLLAFPLMLISVFYMFRVSEAMGHAKQAFVVTLAFVILNLMLSTDISVDGGLQRSFSMPLLLAMAHYLIQKKDIQAAIVVFLGVIYPPMFVVNAAAYGFSLLGRSSEGRFVIAWRRIWPLLIASLLAMLMLLPAFLLQVGSEDVINQTSSEQVHILQDPAFGMDGRFALFEALFFGDGGLYNFNLTGLATTVMIVLSGFIWLLLREDRQRLPTALWLMFAAGVLGFVVSWLGIFVTSSMALYIPNRYIRGILYINSFLFVAFNLGPVTHVLTRKIMVWMRRPVMLIVPVLMVGGVAFGLLSTNSDPEISTTTIRVLQILIVVLLLIVVGLLAVSKRNTKADDEPVEVEGEANKRPLIVLGLFVAVLLIIGGFAFKSLFHEFHVPTEDERALYSYLETLPAASLIAGHPCSLDSVQMYAKRKVLYSCEIPNPDNELMLAALDSYYSEDLQPVGQFCKDYDASHLVIDMDAFSAEAYEPEEIYFEPYNSELADRLTGRQQFALLDIEEDAKLFESGSLFVISCTMFADL